MDVSRTSVHNFVNPPEMQTLNDDQRKLGQQKDQILNSSKVEPAMQSLVLKDDADIKSLNQDEINSKFSLDHCSE